MLGDGLSQKVKIEAVNLIAPKHDYEPHNRNVRTEGKSLIFLMPVDKHQQSADYCTDKSRAEYYGRKHLVSEPCP